MLRECVERRDVGGHNVSVSLTQYCGGHQTLQPTADFILNWRLGKFINVSATSGLTATLAPAKHATPGMFMLVRNEGANAFDVEDYDGGAVATIGAGETWEIRLYDNSSDAGQWLAKQA